MGFIFVGANITSNSWIAYLFSVKKQRRFGNEVNGVGALDAVPNALGQPSKFVFQKLVPGCFTGAHNDMAKFLKSTGDGVNDGIGLETAKVIGCIGVYGAYGCWLLMAAVEERVPGRVGRDEMWQ